MSHESENTLIDLHVPEWVTKQFEDMRQDGDVLARIVRVDRGWPLAQSEVEAARVELAAPLARKAMKDPMKRVAVGDWVILNHPEGHEMPQVRAVLGRSSAFLRKDPGEQVAAQVVIANVDLIFVVIALSERPINLARLERLLVLAHESGAEPVILLTKSDLLSQEEIDEALSSIESVRAGLPVIVQSAVSMQGIDEMRALIGHNTTAAMIGASGVGKSTLANKLVGFNIQQTAKVRESDDKGRHTTVAREIIDIPGAGVLIDTPGLRTIAPWSGKRGLPLAFPEIYEAAENCRFADCSHKAEPQCGVRAALEGGEIDKERMARYLKLKEELDAIDDARTKSWKKPRI